MTAKAVFGTTQTPGGPALTLGVCSSKPNLG